MNRERERERRRMSFFTKREKRREKGERKTGRALAFILSCIVYVVAAASRSVMWEQSEMLRKKIKKLTEDRAIREERGEVCVPLYI